MMRGLTNRRGMTLVLTMFMMTVMIGVAAFVVDFGRMYLIRAQLHSSSDAAAIAGMYWASAPHAVGVTRADGLDTAYWYAKLDSTVRDTVQISRSCNDIAPGTWTSGTGFQPTVPACDWDATGMDAVKVTTRYRPSYGFGRFFGFTTRQLSATSVAVRGSVGRAPCVRPWAIPLQLMLNSLATAFPSAYPSGPPNALTYTLTDVDVTYLSQMTIANNTPLKVGDQQGNWTVTNGNFYAVELPPILYADGSAGSPWSGGNNYRTAIGGSCATLAGMMGANPFVGVGDWLAPENGNMKGPTMQGIQDLCGGLTCSPPVKITAALWDQAGDAPGTNGCSSRCFHIKYLGVFYVTGYDQATDAVMGFFQTTVNVTGGFVAAPGPIQRIALVQ